MSACSFADLPTRPSHTHFRICHTTHSDSSDLCRIFDLSSKPVRLPCKGMTKIVLNATAGSAQAASRSALDYQRVCLASKHALVTMLMHP